MSSPYTNVSITGYNTDPPEDDGSQIASNQVKWSKHTDKIGDPLKTAIEGIDTNVQGAFNAIYGQTNDEAVALVTPTGSYLPHHIRRYGDAAGNGVTDDRQAFVDADAVGGLIIVDGENDYLINSNLTITTPVYIAPGARLSIPTGVVVTLNGGVIAEIGDWAQKFTGLGSVVIGKAQLVKIDWWDRTSVTCLQDALDATQIGSTIMGRGEYTLQGGNIIHCDESAQTGDISKVVCGVGGPGLRLNSASSADAWGCEFKMANSQNKDFFIFDGEASTGRIQFMFDRVKINGNKANNGSPPGGAGLNGDCISIDAAWGVKDVWFKDCVIENAKRDNMNMSGAGGNQWAFDNCEIHSAGRDNINVGAVGDWKFGRLILHSAGRHNLNCAAGHVQGETVHAYFAGQDIATHTNGYNFLWSVTTNNARGQFNSIRSTDAKHNGIRISGANCHIAQAYVNHNGVDTGAANRERSGILFVGASCKNNTIDLAIVTDDDGTPTQTYHIYSDASLSGNRVNDMELDGNATIAETRIGDTLATRSATRISTSNIRAISTASGSVEVTPELGDLVFDTTLTGGVTLNYTTATAVGNGHKQTLYFQNGGGQAITAGTNITEIATIGTLTTAKKAIVKLEYHNGAAYVTEAYKEP